MTASAVSSYTPVSPSFAFVTPKDPLAQSVRMKGTVSGTDYAEDVLYQQNTDKDGKDIPVDGRSLPLDTVVVVKYDSEMKRYYFQGQQQIHVMVKLVDRVPTDEEKEKDKETENCNDIKYICLTDAANSD